MIAAARWPPVGEFCVYKEGLGSVTVSARLVISRLILMALLAKIP
jgi:hypothetical protein